MEAGNRSFDQRVPEEINRKIVDHLSDINMPLTEQARDYLVAEGLKPQTVIKTGSPMLEVLNENMTSILDTPPMIQFGTEHIKEKVAKTKAPTLMTKIMVMAHYVALHMTQALAILMAMATKIFLHAICC